KALFAVAITLTTGEKAEQAGLGRAQRVAQIALPHLAHCSLDLGTPRVDQALTGTIDEAQPGVTGATLDHPPAALLAAGAVLLDTKAPPQAWLAGQRPANLHVRQRFKHPVEFDVALCRRTNLRGRRIEQMTRLRPAPHAPPGTAKAGAEGNRQGEEEAEGVHLQHPQKLI